MSKDNFSFIDELYVLVRAGKDPDTNNLYITQEQFKKANIEGFKAAMLEVIGEDEPKDVKYPPNGFSNIRFDVSKPRNNLRAEQRLALETLVNSKEKEK